jgi:hypothetical protein
MPVSLATSLILSLRSPSNLAKWHRIMMLKRKKCSSTDQNDLTVRKSGI